MFVIFLTLLSACAAPTAIVTPQPPSTTSADSGDSRPFSHSQGTTDIPVDPQRIVTLQDQNALLPLLELGVKPVGSACHILPDGTEIFRRTEGFDTAGITCVGAYWGESNAESVAALNPDLIVGYEFNSEYYDLHNQIAPTVLIQIFDRPLDEALMEFAALVDRTEQAEEMRAEYETRLSALSEGLGEAADQLSVSVITAGDAGQFWRADTGQALGTVMDDLGFARPAAQVGEGGLDAFSIETLPDHDADVVIVIDFSGEGQDPNFQALVGSPLYAQLAASQAGQAYILDGSTTVGAAWGKMYSFLDELDRILLDPELDTNVVQEE